MLKQIKTLPVAVILLAATSPVALAASTGMPWDTPLQTFETDMTGPVAKAVGILAIVFFGLAFSFSEHGSVFRKAMGIIMGLSIAFSASSFGMTFLGFSGGAGF